MIKIANLWKERLKSQACLRNRNFWLVEHGRTACHQFPADCGSPRQLCHRIGESFLPIRHLAPSKLPGMTRHGDREQLWWPGIFDECFPSSWIALISSRQDGMLPRHYAGTPSRMEPSLLTFGIDFSLRFSTSGPSYSSSCCWFARAPMSTISPRVSWTEIRTGMRTTIISARAINGPKANNWPDRVMGIFWKCARIGERLSPYISICCVIMAVRILLPMSSSISKRVAVRDTDMGD